MIHSGASSSQQQPAMMQPGQQPGNSASSSCSSGVPPPTSQTQQQASREGARLLAHLWVHLEAEEGQQEPPQFACLWANCEQRCGVDIQAFETHLEQHLASYAYEMLTSSTAQQEGVEVPPTPTMCQVRGCHILVTSVEELSRHLKMHIFHANKQHCGLKTIRERHPELKGCNFEATSRLVYQGDPLICEWNSCYASFIDINGYMTHVELHIKALDYNLHRNDEGLYVCHWNDCHATFKHKSQLRCHIQHHSGDKVCACPFCGAFFAHNSGLLEHVTRRQTGELMCHFCRKTFMSESVLRKHCKRHIKQHPCKYCSLIADTQHDLHRHIQSVHAKVKNHICEYCGRGFFQRSDYSKHVELHFSDTLHECKVCGQRYRWAKQLKDHERRHQEDYIQSPYQCHLCTSCYRRGSALSKHLTTGHKLEVPTGYSRFQYKKCADGLFRLQTLRYVRETLMEEEGPENAEEEETLT